MSVKNKFASALFSARMRHKLTQAKTAELLGISVRWYQKIEKGTSEPNLALLCSIQKYFNINLASCADEEEFI